MRPAKLTVIFLIMMSNIRWISASTDMLKPGQAGGQFLKIPLAAKARALGGSFVGRTGDASVLEYNPAGLIDMGRLHLETSKLSYFEGVDISGLYAGGNRGRYGFAFHYRQLSAEDTGRDIDGNVNGEIEHKDSLVIIGGSLSVYGNISVGAAVKIADRKISEDLDSGDGFKVSSRDFLYDLGLTLKIPARNDTYGISLQNIGAPSRFDYDGASGNDPFGGVGRGVREPLPQILRLGGTHPFRDMDYVWEIMQPRDNRLRGSCGADYNVNGVLSLLAGIEYQRYFDFNLGAGIKRGSFTVDYAFSPRRDLGNTHLITVGFRF